MSLLTSIRKKLPNVTVKQQHDLFLTTVKYHCGTYGSSLKLIHKMIGDCYNFDDGLTPAAFRLWSRTKYVMVNLKFFTLWWAKRGRLSVSQIDDAAKRYGVKKCDAYLINDLLSKDDIEKIDDSLTSIEAVNGYLETLKDITPQVAVAVKRTAAHKCRWICKSSSTTIDDIVADILGELVCVYYADLPNNKCREHVELRMFKSVGSRVANYLDKASAGKRKRSVQIKHKDGSVDYEYVERNETQMCSSQMANTDSDTPFSIDALAEDQAGVETLSDYEFQRSKEKVLRTTKPTSKKGILYRLLFGEHNDSFYDYLRNSRITRSLKSCCEWIAGVPLSRFVSVFSTFAGVNEQSVVRSIAQLRAQVA